MPVQRLARPIFQDVDACEGIVHQIESRYLEHARNEIDERGPLVNALDDRARELIAAQRVIDRLKTRERRMIVAQTRNFLEKVDVVPPPVRERSGGEANDLLRRSPDGLLPDKSFEVEHARVSQIASTPLGQFGGGIPTIDRI